MEDTRKTKKQLAVELAELRRQLTDAHRQLAELEAAHLALRPDEPSADGTVSVDMDGRITACNQAYAEMLGYSPQELTGNPYRNLTSPHWHTAYDDILQEVMTRGYSYEYEKEYTRKDGMVIPVSLRTWRIDDANGTPIGFRTVARDITVRKQVERERERYSERLEDLIEDRTRTLRESGENFRALAENADDGILISSAVDESHTYANRRAAEITGYTVADLLKMTVKDLIAPEEFGQAAERFRTQPTPPQCPRQIETTIVRKDAQHVPVELTVSRTVWHGQPAFMTIIRDITERKRAEEALRESEEKFRTLAEQSPNMIFINRKGAVVYANRRCEEVMGYTREAFYAPDFDFLTMVAPEDRDQIAANLARHAENEDIEPYEYALITKDGQRVEAIITSKLIDYAGDRAILGIVTDITERKRAEKALLEREERYRQALENSPNPIFSVDRDGLIQTWNPACEQILQYRGADIIGQAYHKLLWSPDDRPAIEALLAQVWQGASLRQQEIAYRSSEGTQRFTVSRLYPLYDSDGEVQACVFANTDITDRKQAEEALRESEETYRMLVETSPYAVTTADLEGRITYVSRQALELHGTDDPEDLLGKSALELIAPQDHEKAGVNIQKTLRGEIVRNAEYVMLRKDGSSFIGELSATMIRGARGEPRAFLATTRDITERKRAEDALRESEARYHAIFNQSPDCIYLTDPQGNILDANPAMLSQAGLSLEEMRQRNVLEAFAGENVEELYQACLAILEGREIRSLQIQAQTPRGESLEYEINAIPLMENGQVVATLSVGRDITERRRLEEQMQQQEQMAAIGRLAGGIAHDFNNFLMSIMLYAQILLRKPDLPPTLASYVETILNESQRAAGLVRQILDFSRRSMMETQVIDLASLVRRTFDFLRETLPENIRLLLEVEADERGVPLMINADPRRVQQVVVNLALNARDAMTEGGDLRIALSKVQVQPGKAPPVAGMSAGDWARLTISDTGIGMTEEVRSHLFEPFFTTKEPGQGTGLGLAQVYGIIKQHGGHIDVETKAGQGTTFSVYLPAQQGTEEQAAEKLERLPQGQGEIILLVEDEETIRDAGREMLESLGYQVLLSANGQEALEMCRSVKRIDLVFTDLVMPEMGGLELIQKLRKSHPHVKTLAVTGYPHLHAEEHQALQKMGVCDIIQKPLEARVLAKTIRQILDAD